MHGKYNYNPNEASSIVFFDCRWKLLNLMAAKNLKIIFRELFFEHQQMLNFFLELLVKVSIDSTPLLCNASKTFLVEGFII